MIVSIRPPLDGTAAERFLVLACSLVRTETADELERERLLGDELRWVHGETGVSDKERDAYEAAVRVLADLHRLGWKVRESGYGVELSMRTPRTGGLCPREVREEKANTRALFRPAVKAQLGDPSVRTFVARMEDPGAKTGKRPITLLIADGAELHSRLTGVERSDLEGRFSELPIRPYLQLVTKGHTDEFTGHNLREIWRYFRYTWSIPQFATPGRQLLYLVRDAAHPCHAVMGLIGLNNSALQMGEIRENDLGWSREALIERLKTATEADWLGGEFSWLEARIADALIDIETQGLATIKEISDPDADLIARLRRSAREFDHLRDETLRRLSEARASGQGEPDAGMEVQDGVYPPVFDAVLNLEPKPSTSPTMQRARRFLVARKRAALLAELLQARRTLRIYRTDLTDPVRLPTVLDREDVGVALQTVLETLKSRYAGVNILEVSTCGGIAPYNVVLGGKLAALMLYSPQIADDYRCQYSGPSIIASQLKNAEVQRDNTLVYLATTSLYAHGSSQYERVRLPAGTISSEQEELRFRRLGKTRGYGTMQFLNETRAAVERFLHHHQGFGDINSIFGEGPSPKLRLFTAGMARLGFPPDQLMSHNQRRLIYSISLAEQAQDLLSSRSTKLPDYLLNPEDFRGATERIAQYWTIRWLSRRLGRADSMTALLVHSSWRLSDQLPVEDDAEETEMPQNSSETDASLAVGPAAPEQDFWLQIAAAGPKTVSDALTPDELARLHIDLDIEPFIADQVAKGVSIFLTGNAGDGKTHILRRLAPRLKKYGAVVVEDATACMRKNQITPVLEKWREAKRADLPFCIAINEYPLYLLRSKAKETLPELAEELDRQCRETLVHGESRPHEGSKQDLLVIDLSLRNPLSPGIAGAMLERILQDQSLGTSPSLDYNRERLFDSVVKQRLLELFRRLADIGVRVTMRELWILLARLVLGFRGDLKDPIGPSVDYRYVQVLFSKDQRFALGEALEFADPARHSHPIWDSILEERDESSVDGWNFGVPVLGVADRPDRKIFQALKRSFYFEHDDGEACFALDDPDAMEFRDLLRNAADSNPKLKRQLVHGLNRAFCAQDFPGCEDNLYLWNGHRFHEQPSRSYLAHRYIPGVRLELLHPRIPARVAAAFPEYEADHLLLRKRSDPGVDLPPKT
ncbi:MAG: DUF4338 domain-containing protein [Pseudomonadota bacterium]|nr:DUF4338 domain-containing protein [Pseudomonadota bacterium]